MDHQTTDRPRPKRLGHLVLWVRDLKKSTAFYTDILGLTVSDWIGDRMVFLRAGTDHHDLGLVQLPPDQLRDKDDSGPRLEHFSYFVETFEDVERIARFLQHKGVPIDRGPGKHGPGANTFLVFKDPDGHNVEVYSDMIIVDQDHPHEAKVWPDSLETFDRWGLKKWLVEPPAWIKKRFGL
jgi:catechol 2,3-dioxygenase-like lactoylglutathione lyase family enzyme